VHPFQATFIDLLARFEVIRFGDFTLKSGRRSPYFINAGQLRTGGAMVALGEAYCEQIERCGAACDLVFGPAYKGVPLAVATAMARARSGIDTGFAFDRKESKDHGEGGTFVGTQPADGMRVVIVDDVITSGISVQQSVALLQRAAAVDLTAVIVAVDREERGRGDSHKTTLRELADELGVRVHPIVTIREIVAYLHGRSIEGRILVDDHRRDAIADYLVEHGVP
jgi:orotate phosphoribosyltransferase